MLALVQSHASYPDMNMHQAIGNIAVNASHLFCTSLTQLSQPECKLHPRPWLACHETVHSLAA